MKTKNLLLFSLLLTLFPGCSKEPVIQPQTEPEEISAQTESEEVGSQLKSQTIGVLYVNNFYKKAGTFDTILGHANRESNLLNWCKAEGFTELNLYGIGGVLSAGSAQKAQLNAFVGKAHSAMYGLKVNFVAGSSNGVNAIGTYCANYPNKPDGIITEYEFWNKDKETGLPNSFATFKKILSAMTVVHNTYPSIRRYAFVNLYSDYTNQYSTHYVRHYLIDNCETIFLENYYTNAYNLTNDFKIKLSDLSYTAKQINKVANVIVIFNVYQNSNRPNIFTYFSVHSSNHKFEDAYNNLMDDYNLAVNEDDDGLSFKGYAIYRHTDARHARPLIR